MKRFTISPYTAFVTLPPAATGIGAFFRFFKAGDGTYAVTIAGAGMETVNGAASTVITALYSSVTLVSDGVSNWYIAT